VLATYISVLVVFAFSSLRVPAPTGSFAVGRAQVSWIDPARDETQSAAPDDRREVPTVIWYPAGVDSGAEAEYVPGLAQIEDGLVEVGAASRLEVEGLQLVRDSAREMAEVSETAGSYPLLILSPGNMTNVSFYAAIAQDLASNGYIVIGVDHPYSVAAVALENGSVALAAGRDGLGPQGVVEDVARRVADIEFVIDRVTSSDERLGFLEGRVDVGRIGVLGHSLGGIAAVEACQRDTRIAACMNIDGQAEGGPFSTDVEGEAPSQRFMFLTKETQMHPEILGRFESAGHGAFRVVIPAASHEDFVDSSLFVPSLFPWSRSANDVMGTARGFTLAFFEHALRGKTVGRLGDVDATTDSYVNVYPLGPKPSIP
jgi:dienelactone hydrolase